MAARKRSENGSVSEPGKDDSIACAYIGLGSNLADPVSQIKIALRALGQFPGTTVLDCSGLYQNQAMTDPLANSTTPQPDYLNAVAAIETGLAAHDLLTALLNQEFIQGRRRTEQHWEARCIDLDLLLYADQKIQSKSLAVPHPGVHQRPFVIHPLAEIAPSVVIPGLGTAAHVAKIIARDSLTLICQGSELLE